jgi:hypothetical protein
MKLSKKAKHRLLYFTGMIFCILPAAAVIISEFPLWVEKGNSALASGIVLSASTLFLLSVAFTPLWRAILARLRSPAAFIMWGIMTFLFISVKNLIDSLILISFAGFAGNLIGAVFFELASRYSDNGRGVSENE